MSRKHPLHQSHRAQTYLRPKGDTSLSKGLEHKSHRDNSQLDPKGDTSLSKGVEHNSHRAKSQLDPKGDRSLSEFLGTHKYRKQETNLGKVLDHNFKQVDLSDFIPPREWLEDRGWPIGVDYQTRSFPYIVKIGRAHV